MSSGILLSLIMAKLMHLLSDHGVISYVTFLRCSRTKGA